MAAVDNFATNQTGPGSPYSHVETVTPSDSVDLTNVSRALLVKVAGDVAVIMVDGSTATLGALQPGNAVHVRVSRVKSTGTTATGIVALS